MLVHFLLFLFFRNAGGERVNELWLINWGNIWLYLTVKHFRYSPVVSYGHSDIYRVWNDMRTTKWFPPLFYRKPILRSHSNTTFQDLLSCFIKSSHWACQHSYGHHFESCGSCSQHVILSACFFSVDFLVCKNWHDGDTVCIGDSLHTLSQRKFCLQCQTDMTRVSLSLSVWLLDGKDFFSTGVEWEKQLWLIFAKRLWPFPK